jgi:asparagine synthase (glutamine-hydrolysing)
MEFAMKIPPQLKLKNDTLKYLLRHALKEYLPDEILNRPKHGFGAPVENWLRKPLREMTRDYLVPGCRIEMLVGRNVITDALDAVYKTAKCDDYRTPFKLWLLLVLEVWMRKYCQPYSN